MVSVVFYTSVGGEGLRCLFSDESSSLLVPKTLEATTCLGSCMGSFKYRSLEKTPCNLERDTQWLKWKHVIMCDHDLERVCGLDLRLFHVCYRCHALTL